MSLKGNLRSFSLGEILQSLALNRHTGTLIVREGSAARTHTIRYIHFAEGEITFVSPSSPRGFRLGEILVKQGKISDTQLQEALAVHRNTGEKLGATLLSQGLVSAQDITGALTAQLKEELYDLFLLEEAEFEFNVNEEPPDKLSPIQRLVKVTIAPQPVIIEGLRRLDEWSVIRTHIRTGNEILTPTGAPPLELSDEEREVYARLDGRTPVNALHERISVGRFECAKALFNLLTAGLVRPLTREELLALAGEVPLECRHPFLACALQQTPADLDVRVRLARALVAAEDAEAALNVLHEGLDALDEQAHRERALLASEALALRSTDTKGLSAALWAALEQDDDEAALRHALALSDQLRRENNARGAQDALARIEDRVPADPRAHLAVARAWDAAGAARRGVPHLEAAANRFESARDWPELSRVLRWIINADPTRQDARLRLSQISADMQKRERRKRRRLLITAAVACLLGAVMVVPIIYETKARHAFAAAAVQEGTLVPDHLYSKAQDGYRNVLESYGYSSVAGEARDAIERLETAYRLHEESKAREERIERERIERLRREPERLLRAAVAAEDAGDLGEAHAILTSVLTRFPDSPQAAGLTMPLRLMSIPSGAMVFTSTSGNGKTTFDGIGRTPLTLRYRPGQELTLHLRRTGCSESVLDLSTLQTWQHTVRMGWAPIDQFSYENTPVHGALHAAGESVVFSARDGVLHAIDPIGRVVKWRRRIGRFGDPVSRLLIHDDTIAFGTVDGGIQCLSASSGDVIWQAEVPGTACFAPLRTPDGDILAATTAGHVVRLRGGKIVAQAQVEGACTSGPALAGDIVAVASTPDTCTAFDADTLAPRWRRVFDAGIAAGPCALGNALVLVTAQHILYALCPEQGEKRWQVTLPAPLSTPPHVSETHVTLALETGEILQVRADGEAAHRGRAGDAPLGAPLVLGKRLAAGSDNGAFMLFDIEGARVAWLYESPAPIAARPCVIDNKLIFATVNGDFAVMEILP